MPIQSPESPDLQQSHPTQELAKVARQTKITVWTDTHQSTILRLSIGIIYLWFGALKFMPNSSPAEQLVTDTINQISDLIPLLSLPIQPLLWALALLETIIGIGFLTGRRPQIFLPLLALQIIGAALPLILLPQTVWTTFPHILTLEGQYIVKNLMIITAAIAYTKTR